MMRLLPFLMMIVALGSCTARVVPPPRPAPHLAPAPAPAPTTAPRAADWRDWPLTPGDWVYRQDARGSIALFGIAGADADVTLRCDRQAGMLYLSRRGGGKGAPLTIRTTSATRVVASRPTGGTPPYLAVALGPRDPLLDAMGFSRGRFIVEQAGLPPLVVPAWAEIERVTEDCRG